MRALLLALALAAAGCTLTPGLSGYEPKTAADCPGQKACGWRCVDVDDPAAGCAADTCTPCPGGGVNTAPVCAAAQACALACLPGFAAADGDPAHGCAVAVGGDPANCGAIGHACPAGVACQAGECQVAPATEVADTGEAPRGLGVSDELVAWAIDPPVAGGLAPRGELRWSRRAAPLGAGALTGAGHPDVVRVQGGRWAAFTTVDASGGLSVPLIELDGTASVGTSEAGFLHDAASNALVGLVLRPESIIWVESGWNEGYSQSFPMTGTSSGVNFAVNGGDATPRGLGEGAGFVWVGSDVGVSRLDLVDPAWGYEIVSGGGVYFQAGGLTAVPSRIAAVPDPVLADVIDVFFADLTDGSVWMGRTLGNPGEGPARIFRGAGPRTQMDMAADASGVVWSDYDAGELWAVEPGATPHRLASGVSPWAIALHGGRVWFTDVATRSIRSVPR